MIAVCVAGAGFCLVLAMVILVVALNGSPVPPVTAKRSPPPTASARAKAARQATWTSPSRPATSGGHRTRAARQVVPATIYVRYGTSANLISATYQHVAKADHIRASAIEARLASEFAIATPIAVYRGTGPGEPHRFRIAAPGGWGISWAFRCASKRPSSFDVRETGSGSPKGLTVSDFGPSGRGLSWNTLDPGTHELSVTTGCSWVIRIVAP